MRKILHLQSNILDYSMLLCFADAAGSQCRHSPADVHGFTATAHLPGQLQHGELVPCSGQCVEDTRHGAQSTGKTQYLTAKTLKDQVRYPPS